MESDSRLPHHYALLGVSPDAEPEAVKRAWRRLAARWHPDAGHADGPRDRFNALAEAWEVLAEPVRRAAYDAELAASVAAAVDAMSRLRGAQKIAGIVDRVLGVRERRPETGRNRRLRLSVGLAEAVRGTEIKVELDAEVVCEACDATGASAAGRTFVCARCGGIGEVLAHGALRSGWSTCEACTGLGWVPDPVCERCEGRGVVEGTRHLVIPIPPGTRDGQVLRVSGEGEPGPEGGQPGDLLVEVAVQRHPFLTAVGTELRCERPVPFWLALVGGRIEVPTLEGTAYITLPRGARDGDVLRMAGWGLGSGPTRGDQLVVVRLETPSAIDAETLERLQAWGASLPGTSFPETAAFETRLASARKEPA